MSLRDDLPASFGSSLHYLIQRVLYKGGQALTADNLPDDCTLVDVYYFQCALNKDALVHYRDEFQELLKTWPTEAFGMAVPKLSEGPNYIHAGGAVGDQQRALVMFAIGEAMGYWKVMTPKDFGVSDEDAKMMAGMGFVLISGYKDPDDPLPE